MSLQEGPCLLCDNKTASNSTVQVATHVSDIISGVWWLFCVEKRPLAVGQEGPEFLQAACLQSPGTEGDQGCSWLRGLSGWNPAKCRWVCHHAV